MIDAVDDPTCIVTTDGLIVAVNEAWDIFGRGNGSHQDGSGVGANYLAVCDAAAALQPHGDSAKVSHGLRRVLTGAQARYAHEYPCHSPDAEFWFTVRISPVAVDSHRGAVVSHADTTRLHVAHESIAFQRSHDPLTALPNRDLLMQRLQYRLDEPGSGGGPAVAMIGLDGFKRVNNGLGPQRGDEVLLAAARRLAEQIGPGDTLGRVASDEFAVVWEGDLTASEPAARTETLIAAIRDPFEIGGAIVHLTASAGVAAPAIGDRPTDVLTNAAVAMREAKRRGGDRVREYSTTIADTWARRLAIESELRTAVERSELKVHYQPIVDITTGEPTKVEALLRWDSPTRGRVPPDEFIPVAESTGLILPIGRWVLSQACEDAAAFTGAASHLEVAVNLSGHQLTDPSLVEHVRTALSDSGLDPHRLYLEVTEWSLMQDEDMAEAILKELTHLGVRVAIDDFGTGYSSLLYLRRYPVAVLKLDRAFVSGIGFSPDDEAICRGVVGLANWMGLDCVAEGVETADQARELRSFGCALGQGYLWSPAVPLDHLPAALDACRSADVHDGAHAGEGAA